MTSFRLTNFTQEALTVSKIITSAAIRGAHKIAYRVETKYAATLKKYGPDQDIGFPDTAYYLPIIYAMLGIPVKTLGDCQLVFHAGAKLLPPLVKEKHHLPYLAPALDAGMATLFYEEIEEAIRYLEQPNFYLIDEDVTDSNIWLGAANDVILRKRGVEFVDGSAPVLRPCWEQPLTKRPPSRSLRSSSSRICMSLWPQAITARAFPSSWLMPGCRSAGTRALFLWPRHIRRGFRPRLCNARRHGVRRR